MKTLKKEFEIDFKCCVFQGTFLPTLELAWAMYPFGTQLN
jgi:hypothetical protein